MVDQFVKSENSSLRDERLPDERLPKATRLTIAKLSQGPGRVIRHHRVGIFGQLLQI